MKLSHGLKLILEPLHKLTHTMDINLCHSYFELLETMRKVGKRGRQATLYPTDFRKVNLILETWHEVTFRHYEIEVKCENVQDAINSLADWIREEDYIINSLTA